MEFFEDLVVTKDLFIVMDEVDRAIGPKHLECPVNLMDPYKGSLLKDGLLKDGILKESQYTCKHLLLSLW